MNHNRSYLNKLKDCKRSFHIILVIAAMMLLSETCYSSDLDDGIPIDSDIPYSDSIKTGINIAFLKRSAKSMSVINPNGEYQRTSKDGSTNIVGGAYIGKGSTVKGPITVIFDGKNINNYGF